MTNSPIMRACGREGLAGRPLVADRRQDGEGERGGNAERQRTAGEIERTDDDQSRDPAVPRALFTVDQVTAPR
jgi:hypothetical protein